MNDLDGLEEKPTIEQQFKPAKNGKKRKVKGKKQFQPAPEDSFNDGQDNNNPVLLNEKVEHVSEGQMRGPDQITMGDNSGDTRKPPYEFLEQRTPSILRIFFPRFAVKTITFFLSIFYVVMFIVLVAYNYSKSQNDYRWNCSLFQLQNKYFPRLRYNYEIWRVFTSAVFHSNIAHFFLNMFGLQIYGYVTEWYYGKMKYTIVLTFSIILAHFLSSVTSSTSVSTTSSSVLFAIIGLKLLIFVEFRNYKKLDNRRVFVYLLLGLVIGINLIPIFVVNNVDYGSHLGGLLSGFLFGVSFYVAKQEEELTKCEKLLKYGTVVILALALIALVALVFTTDTDNFRALNDNIDSKCD